MRSVLRNLTQRKIGNANQRCRLPSKHSAKLARATRNIGRDTEPAIKSLDSKLDKFLNTEN